MNVTFCFFVTWLSVFRILEEKKTKIADNTCSDRLENLNLVLYIQIFLTHIPLSIPTAVTMYLSFRCLMWEPSRCTSLTLYLVNIFNHSSLFDVCVCSAVESHTYTFVNLWKLQFNDTSEKKSGFWQRSQKQQSYISCIPRISKSPSNFLLDSKTSNKTHK